jgi:uncharacterized protein (TIGR02117 family)
VNHSRKLLSLVAVLLLICARPGCATDGACLDDSTPPELVRSIYIVERGWHTGIAIAAADWPNRDWSLLAQFSDSDYLEFGWGDERFYQAESETVWLGIRAALWPTSSVIHVIGVRSPIVENIDADEIVEVRVSADGLRRMAEAIEREFTERTPTATPVSLSLAPKPNHFYSAKRKFFFPQMCNWWIASRLEEAGCPIQPRTVVTATRILREARSFERATKR